MEENKKLHIRFKIDPQTQSYPSDSLDKKVNPWLELFLKIGSLAAIVGPIFGFLLSFIYLHNINQLSILPDVISNSSALISILFVFSIVVLLFLAVFITPYIPIIYFLEKINEYELLSWFFRRKEENKEENKKLKQPSFLCFAFVPILIILLGASCHIPNHYIFLIFPALPLLFSFYFLLIKLVKFKKLIKLVKFIIKLVKFKKLIKLVKFIIKLVKTVIEKFKELIYSIFIIYINYISTWMLFTIMFIEIRRYAPSDLFYKILVSLVPLILLALNIYIAPDLIATYEKGKSKLKYIFIAAILPTIVIMFLIFLTPNFPTISLSKIRFVERPDNASWYLLHNDFQKLDGTQEIHGINAGDLEKMKNNFKCVPEIDKNKCDNTKQAQARKNALFGYMAWNLGDTKVFCPQNASNDPSKTNDPNKTNDTDKANDIANKCLVIDAKSLQPLPVNYISGEK